MSTPCIPLVDDGARIGLPGAMLEVQCTASITTDTARAMSTKRTMEGRRFALLGMLSRREWGVDFPGLDARVAQSLAMLTRDTTNPVKPLRWYPHDAVTGNLLSPQATEWDPQPLNGSNVGFTKLPDGSLAQATQHIGGGTVSPGDADGASEYVVVTPGEPVTFGTWAFGGLNMIGWWRDSDGNQISSWSLGTQTFAGWQWRQTTRVPPAGASLVSLHLAGASLYARPSISWGNTAHDMPGRGCPSALIHDLSEEIEALLSNRWLGSLSATITEVG